MGAAERRGRTRRTVDHVASKQSSAGRDDAAAARNRPAATSPEPSAGARLPRGKDSNPVAGSRRPTRSGSAGDECFRLVPPRDRRRYSQLRSV